MWDNIKRILKFTLVGILAIFWWPTTKLFEWYSKKHGEWKKTDKISYYLGIPFYWIFFFIMIIFTMPMDALGSELAPPQVKGFK